MQKDEAVRLLYQILAVAQRLRGTVLARYHHADPALVEQCLGADPQQRWLFGADGLPARLTHALAHYEASRDLNPMEYRRLIALSYQAPGVAQALAQRGTTLPALDVPLAPLIGWQRGVI